MKISKNKINFATGGSIQIGGSNIITKRNTSESEPVIIKSLKVQGYKSSNEIKN